MVKIFPPPVSGAIVVHDLTLRVEEAQEALSAIRKGQVDALVIARGQQQQEVVLLQGADKAYQVLFETLNEGAVAIAADLGIILYSNRRFAELVERTLAEVLGARLEDFVSPEEISSFTSLLAAARGASSKGELCLRTKSGAKIPVMTSVRAVVEGDTAGDTFTVVMTDLSALKKAQTAQQEALDDLQGMIRALQQREEQLRASLREKEVLLKEAHHRVKNNLQVISSLLHMQGRYLADRSARELLRESQSRVHSIALVHEALYQSKDLGSIDLEEYLKRLISTIHTMFGKGTFTPALSCDVARVRLGIDAAVQCGLIVNELLTNAFKHAFPDGTEGHVHISVHREGDAELVLEVADDGIGLPEGLDFRNAQSLGLRLVCGLTEQLGGTIELGREGGTRFLIRFPQPAIPPSQPLEQDVPQKGASL